MKPLRFKILGECDKSKARTSVMSLPHHEVETPVFMPVGTQGTLKGLLPQQLEALDVQIVLGNTYHLGTRPGAEIVKKAGGLHKFMNWKRALLTDSGGFQMVSLLKLAEITEEGVKFKSPYSDDTCLLTPEHSIEIQNMLGADIAMQLDDVVSSTLTGPRVEEAMERTTRWLDRCIAAHARQDDQNLFPIVQGGLELSLREKSAQLQTKRAVNGFAIGGLSGGESKDEFWKMVLLSANHLPKEKPRYVMGVGFAEDLVVCCALGADMFDCVFPTRTARFGCALTMVGQISLKKKKFEKDFAPIDSECNCFTCQTFTRSYLNSIVTKETVACHLLSIHNVAFQMRLMRTIRESIKKGTFPQFVQNFMLLNYPEKNYPSWIKDALAAAFAAETSEVLTFHQVELGHEYPKDGWVEQDPVLILNAVEECLERTTDNMVKLDIDPRDLVAVGITNQRETTVLWDKFTGEPLYNAISWSDSRTSEIVDELLKNVRNNNPDVLKPLCGLPVNPYFSALKIKWLMDNIPSVRRAIDGDRCLFGTIDSWLIWNLTGGPFGGVHATDVTNASRTMLMNITTLTWDKRLCDFFSIPISILPEIYSSSEIFGYIAKGVLRGVPISGCLGDQQSALVGQMCLNQGQAKNTYGTGCFLLYNTGKVRVQSRTGLLTTVAYQLGKDAPPIYALEGSIGVAGSALKWLRDNLKFFADVAHTSKLGEECQSPGDVTFVPAFSGLFAPYWMKDAKSIICGITEETKKSHIVKAALEAVCFQTRDVLDAIRRDCGTCGTPVQKLLVDGGMSVNGYLMQLQADLCGIPVVRATISETTALGAAMVAGMAEGIKVWDLVKTPKLLSDTFYPTILEDERDLRYHKWKLAVQKCTERTIEVTDEEKIYRKQSRMYSIAAPAIFTLSSLALVIVAQLLGT